MTTPQEPDTSGPYTPTALPAEPVGVFGCTIRQVGALARNITITADPTEDRDPDLSITTDEIEAWIVQLTAALTARIPLLRRITGTTRTTLLAAGADAIANGAASYAEAAAHPEYAATADATSYAALLWERWQHGTDQLAATIDALIADAAPDVTPDPRGTAAWAFPRPALPDNTRW